MAMRDRRVYVMNCLEAAWFAQRSLGRSLTFTLQQKRASLPSVRPEGGCIRCILYTAVWLYTMLYTLYTVYSGYTASAVCGIQQRDTVCVGCIPI